MQILLISRHIDLYEQDRYTRLMTSLTAMGHTVNVITASYSPLRDKNPEAGLQDIKVNGINYLIISTPHYTFSKKGKFQQASKKFTRSLKKILRRNFNAKNGPDVAIVSASGPTDFEATYNYYTGFDTRVFFDIDQLWPITAVEKYGLKMREFKILGKFSDAENIAFNRAQAVISQLPYAGSYLRSKRFSAGEYYHVVTDGIDIGTYEQYAQKSPKYTQGDLPTIAAFDDLEGLGGLDSLLNAATQADVKANYIIAVKKENVDTLNKKINELSLGDKVALKQVEDHQDLVDVLSHSDIVYYSVEPEEILRYGRILTGVLLPMVLGKPIIYGVEYDGGIVDLSRSGLTVDGANPVAVARAIEGLVNLTVEERKVVGDRGFAYVRAYFDTSVLAKTYESILDPTKNEDFENPTKAAPPKEDIQELDL